MKDWDEINFGDAVENLRLVISIEIVFIGVWGKF